MEQEELIRRFCPTGTAAVPDDGQSLNEAQDREKREREMLPSPPADAQSNQRSEQNNKRKRIPRKTQRVVLVLLKLSIHPRMLPPPLSTNTIKST